MTITLMNKGLTTRIEGSVFSQLVGDIWAVGANSDLSHIVVGSQTTGTIGVSDDGGAHFALNTTTLTPADFTRDILFVDDSNTVLLSTPFNFLHRTTNLGASWTPITAPGKHNWGAFARSDDSSKIIVSSADASYLSTDQGASWNLRTNNAPSAQGYNGLIGSSDFSVLYSTDGSVVSKSVDLGQTWTPLANQPIVDGFWQASHCSADGQIVMYGDVHGNLARSTDGGTSWKYVPDLSPISSLNCFNRRIAGQSGATAVLSGNYFLAKTVDSGVSWNSDPALYPYWNNNFTSPFQLCISVDGISIVTGTEYFNFALLIRR